MPTTHKLDDSVRTNNTDAFELAAGDKLIVGRGITLSSATSYGINAAGNNIISINGAVSGAVGVYVHDAKVTVGAFGVATGENGVFNTDGEMDLDNRGYISGNYQGVSLYGSGRIENHASIVSGLTVSTLNSAIYLGSSHTDVEIINTGVIKARLEGASAILSNSGADAVDKVVNSGKIIGDVHLSLGDDSFESLKGRVNGTIDGGAGKDTLKGSKSNDTLIGGTEHDVLAGGAGSDSFQFELGDGKDTITDFDAVGGGKKQDYLLLAAGMEYTEKSVHNGRDTLLNFGDGQTITLLHVKASDFSDADIQFLV